MYTKYTKGFQRTALLEFNQEHKWMDALLKIPNATNDVKKLRSLYDACEGYKHGLESLDVYPESYGDLLIPIVMKKITRRSEAYYVEKS